MPLYAKGHTFFVPSGKMIPDLVLYPIDGFLSLGFNFFTDLLSNGFKFRTVEQSHNGNGSSYIYMAFASAPLVGTNNIPATAR